MTLALIGMWLGGFLLGFGLGLHVARRPTSTEGGE